MYQKGTLLLTNILLALLLLSPTGVASAPAGKPRESVPAAGTAGPQQITPDTVASCNSTASLLARVDGNRWHADVTTLAQFGSSPPGNRLRWGTRRSLTAGNLAARDWISATLASLGWTPSFHAFNLEGDVSYNIVAERSGRRRPHDIYIVGAHMDSTSQRPWSLAPGAEDNASGTAALLEIARVLQNSVPAGTIRLIAFSGEEQGQIGSEAYASYLQDIGELDNVKGVYILDMIGYTSDPEHLHVLLESRDPNTNPWMGNIRDHLASMAATYTSLNVFTSNVPFGSDHMPFLHREVPAVLLIGNEWASYPASHSFHDLPSYVTPDQGREIMKLIVATLIDRTGLYQLLADLDCDGTVDVRDLTEVAGHWRLSLGEPGYQARYDFDHDGAINIADAERVAADFTR